MRTIQQLAQEALDVQNASNIKGVTLSMHKALCDLSEVANLGNDLLNAHPITRLWVDKVASLCGMDGGYMAMTYSDVRALAEGKK